ncbi:hypothetical protein [Amycolatopsis sp. lyj-346]|uniref:hypothetical protein n=1 Tax=Amycolatopsis sp. lyj-346 TaxID=2789289 RepID=UPI00397E4113
MTRKLTEKNWFNRGLGVTVAAGAMLAITALPAAAATTTTARPAAGGTTATSWGATQQEAIENAFEFCVVTLHGTSKLTVPIVTTLQPDKRWKATVSCIYEL